LIFEIKDQVDAPKGEMPFEIFKERMLIECDDLFKEMDLPDDQFQSFLLLLYVVSDMLVSESIYPNPYKDEL